MQKSLYFEHQGALLVGTLHVPDRCQGQLPGVSLFHGFTGHKIEAHRLFVEASRSLEEAGIVSLRFDFRGSGESQGDFRDVTPSGEISDGLRGLEVLADEPRVDPNRIGLLGLSLGGYVGACVAGQSERVKSVALWSAVARLPEVFLRSRWQLPAGAAGLAVRLQRGLARLAQVFLPGGQKSLSKRLLPEGGIDVGGQILGQGFLADLDTHDALRLIRQSRAPLLVVHGTNDRSVPLAESQLYLNAGLSRNVRTERVLITGADHTFARADWQEAVIRQTVDWFKQTL